MDEWFTEDELKTMRRTGRPIPPEPDMDLIGTVGSAGTDMTWRELFASFLIVCMTGASIWLLHSLGLLVITVAVLIVLTLLGLATVLVWLFVFDRP